jgi:hypothetical protein
MNRLDEVKLHVQARRMKDAITALYFAAHWMPDRECDAAKLWEAVRDAAGIAPGQTAERLGKPQIPVVVRRVSVEESDPGYMAWHLIMSHDATVKILLDGVEQEEVITADESAGFVKRHAPRAMYGGEYPIQVLTGKVELVITPKAKASA